MKIIDPKSGLDFLDRDDCMELLNEASGGVGRVAFMEGLHPTVLPVNFVMDGTFVALRTADGTKLDQALRRAAVAFELDRVDEGTRTGWSVLVRGHAEVVEAPADVERLDSLGLRTWSTDAKKTNWVHITPEQVTGRMVTLLTER